MRADGLLGDCQLDMASGQVQLDHIAAQHVAGTATIQGSSGGVRIGEVTGVVTYEASTGNIWIGNALSDVELSNGGGSFDIDRLRPHAARRHRHPPRGCLSLHRSTHFPTASAPTARRAFSSGHARSCHG